MNLADRVTHWGTPKTILPGPGYPKWCRSPRVRRYLIYGAGRGPRSHCKVLVSHPGSEWPSPDQILPRPH